MTLESRDLSPGQSWSAQTVRDTLTPQEFEQKIVRLRMFATLPEYPTDTGYTTHDLALDMGDLVAHMGTFMSPNQVRDDISDPEGQDMLRAYLEEKHPYVISSPAVIPQAVQDLALAKSFFQMVSYETVEIQVQGVDGTVHITYHDRAFIARISFETIPTHIPRMVFVFPGSGEPPIWIIDAAKGKGLPYDPAWQIPKLDEFVHAHMMIAAASLVSQAQRIEEKEASLMADLKDGQAASTVPEVEL